MLKRRASGQLERALREGAEQLAPLLADPRTLARAQALRDGDAPWCVS